MIQTQENGEKPHFGPNLGQLGPIGRAIFFFIFFFYFFFSKIWLRQSLENHGHGQLSSCTILEKTNDPILKRFSDGRRDERIGQTDRRTIDSIGRCSTNVERPSRKFKIMSICKITSICRN